MSKVCPITGKRPVTGHHVSHSQRHVKRRWMPNLINVTLTDERGRKVRVRIAAKALRTLCKAPRIK
ncbi:50S ribosomal protein L28 [bacterium]|nr:50S ribosomal protein L28 [bacterium]